MKAEFVPAIDGLEAELALVEQKAAELRGAINTLCRLAGAEPRYSEADNRAQAAPSLSQLRPDTFYGKKMQTAAREFLEMRKAANLGPASPREVFEALRDGGYQFETKDEGTAQISLRATLRKNSQTFHKLPNGQYGLKLWYPNAKTTKDDIEDDADRAPPKSAVKRPRKGSQKPSKTPKSKPTKADPQQSAADSPLPAFVLSAMSDNKTWTLDALVKEAETRGVPGPVNKVLVHGKLLGLKSRGLVRLVEKGVWQLVAAPSPSKDAAAA